MALQSVLITGCSEGGIGYALAKAFQSHRFQVFASARTLPKILSLGHLAGVTLLELDVTSSTSIDAAVDAVRAKTGGTLGCLVNCAGCLSVMPMLDVDVDAAKRLFDVNF